MVRHFFKLSYLGGILVSSDPERSLWHLNDRVALSLSGVESAIGLAEVGTHSRSAREFVSYDAACMCSRQG